MKSLASEFPKIVIDQGAETVKELKGQWPLGISSLKEFIAKKIKAGEWEQVYKRSEGRLSLAYRRTEK